MGDGPAVCTLCDVVLKSVPLLPSCAPKQVFLNICCDVRYKATGEVEREHFRCLLNDGGI